MLGRIVSGGRRREVVEPGRRKEGRKGKECEEEDGGDVVEALREGDGWEEPEG